jgi:hypothetical protein
MIKNKFIKTLLIVSGLMLIGIIGFFIYGSIMTFGNQRLETVPITKELKKLEKEIQNETKSGDYSFFNGIAKPDVENCNSNFDIRLSIDNDSLTKTNENLIIYIQSVNNRVNKFLTDKKCIDSIIMHVSIDNKRDVKGVLIEKRYSFPVK